MKFIRKSKAGRDNDVDVAEFKLGTEELKILKGLLERSCESLPKIFETGPMRNRMKNMISAMTDGLIELTSFKEVFKK